MVDVKSMKALDTISRGIPMVFIVCSLVMLYAYTQIDTIVHGTLYDYGLEFNTAWATPYWNTGGILIAMGWTIVVVASLFQAYLVIHKVPATSSITQLPEAREEERWNTFKLGDGSTIKVKLVVKGAKRLNKYSSDGMPVYTVDTEPIVRVVDVPEALKVASSS